MEDPEQTDYTLMAPPKTVYWPRENPKLVATVICWFLYLI